MELHSQIRLLDLYVFGVLYSFIQISDDGEIQIEKLDDSLAPEEEPSTFACKGPEFNLGL